MTLPRATVVVIAFLGAALGGCAESGEGPEAGQGAAGDGETVAEPSTQSDDVDLLERTGRVVVSGPDGLRMVSVQTEAGESVGLAGDLLGELTRLSGAVVEVTGTPAQTLLGDGVQVTHYEVVSVDGQTPAVGVLENGGFLLRLEDGESVTLMSPSEELAAQVGAKVWVTGPQTPTGLRVQSYGVIRPPG